MKISIHGCCYNLLYFIINYVKNPCILIARFVTIYYGKFSYWYVVVYTKLNNNLIFKHNYLSSLQLSILYSPMTNKNEIKIWLPFL